MSRFSGAGVVAVSAVLAGVLYSSFWLELALPTGLDPIRAYASELFARDQPFRPLFAATEIASGTLAIVAGARALPRAERGLGRLGLLGRFSVILFGALTAADALLPMDCAVSDDPACARAEEAGRLSVVHDLHAVSSSLAVAAALAGMFALARSGLTRALAVTQLVVTAALLVTMLTGAPVVGLVQWVQVTLFSVWLVAIGLSQARRRNSR